MIDDLALGKKVTKVELGFSSSHGSTACGGGCQGLWGTGGRETTADPEGSDHHQFSKTSPNGAELCMGKQSAELRTVAVIGTTAACYGCG